MKEKIYTIGICDDEKQCRDRISMDIRLMCQKMEISYELKTYDCGEAVLAEEEIPDILFLDEELADGKEHMLNGSDLRADFERRSLRTLIICITSHNECMQDAFGIGVMGFVTKGCQDETQRMRSVFRRCIEKLDPPQTEVAYIEARGHDVRVVYTDGTEEILTCSIGTAEEKYKEQGNLFRCGRSYIVNIAYVDKPIGNFERLIMKDKTEISITRAEDVRQRVKSAYLAYRDSQMSKLFGDE